MIGNNSCGVHSVMAGNTVDNVEELEVLTYDGLRLKVGPTSDEELDRIIAEGGRRGEIYARPQRPPRPVRRPGAQRFPKIPRRVSGYNLDQLLPENGFNVARALVGTEGTCVTVLEATVRLAYSPPARSLVVLGLRRPVRRPPTTSRRSCAHRPVGLEGIDDVRRGLGAGRRDCTCQGLAVARRRRLAAGRVRRRDPRGGRRPGPGPDDGPQPRAPTRRP